MVGPIDVKQKGNESNGYYADLGNFDLELWPWILKAKLYLDARLSWNETGGSR